MKNIPTGWDYKESDHYPLAATLTRGNTRAVVRYIEGTDCPLEWYDTIELLPLAWTRMMGPLKYAADTLGVASSMEYAREYAADDDAYRAAILKHCARHGYEVIVRSWRGYSQGDWLDYVLISDGESVETLEAIAREFEAWLNGDVLIAVVERRVTYANISDPNDTIDRWIRPDNSDACDHYEPFWELDATDVLAELGVL